MHRGRGRKEAAPKEKTEEEQKRKRQKEKTEEDYLLIKTDWEAAVQDSARTDMESMALCTAGHKPVDPHAVG